jgi:HD-GYP domain-containing protein (c-di-GMP phosphodiesterase class II)
LKASLPVIRHHHEHFAGGGYPDGLVGDAIPLLARIISVVDAYDAMTTTRPYRVAMPVSRACEILATNTGPQWDPMIVARFLELLAREPAARVGRSTSPRPRDRAD